MQKETERGTTGSVLGPILLSIALVIALVGALYALWAKQSQSGAAQQLLNEQAFVEKLEKELLLFRGWLAAPPCEVQQFLSGGAVPAAPVSQVAPSAPKTAPQPAPTPASPGAMAAGITVGHAEDATVFIVGLGNDGSVSTGTGFFVAPGIIVTNRHVVETGNKAILVTSKKLGRPVAGKIIGQSTQKERDYAVLQVKLPEGVMIPALPLRTDSKRTDKVGAWGFPHVIAQNDPKYKEFLSGNNALAVPELAYSEGVVSAILERSPDLIVHTAPISPGNSGGPLMNNSGEVIGINTMITLDEESYRQASIALSARDLVAFLKEAGVTATVDIR